MKCARYLLLPLALIAFSPSAFSEDKDEKKDPVCGIFKRVVKQTSAAPGGGSVTTVQHTGYVFKADGTGYIYYWDNQTKETISGPDFTWERRGRNSYRYTRTWKERQWDGREVTKRELHDFTLSEDGKKVNSPDEPPYREEPTFYRVP